mgnify:CR=1 FL=1
MLDHDAALTLTQTLTLALTQTLALALTSFREQHLVDHDAVRVDAELHQLLHQPLGLVPAGRRGWVRVWVSVRVRVRVWVSVRVRVRVYFRS